MDAEMTPWVILGAVWLVGWAASSVLAIRAVKDDDSWMAWDLEDQLPFIVAGFLLLWPWFALKILKHRMK
jgi:hypothetical protein